MADAWTPIEKTKKPADGWQPIGPQTGGGQIKALAGKAGAAKRALELTRDPSVDYSGINDPGNRAIYSFLDTDEERLAFLRQKYGAKNVEQDKYGRPVILKDGKRIAFKPEFGESRAGKLGADLSDLAGDVLPTAGAVVGDIAGGGSTPAGIALAGVGGAAGRSGNKILKDILGYNLQGPGETAVDIGKTGALTSLGSGVGRGMEKLVRTAQAPYAKGSIFGPWDRSSQLEAERLATLKDVRGLGLRPNIGTYQPRAKFLGAGQQAGFNIFGSDNPIYNRPILEREMGRLEEGAAGGIPPAPMRQTDTLNEALSKRAERTVAVAESEATAARKEADALLSEAEKSIRGTMPTAPANLGRRVADDIEQSRIAWGNKASGLYEPVDKLVGAPVVPTKGLKKALNEILAEVPPTQSGELSVLVPENLKTFARGIQELPENITFKQMQATRIKFRSKAELDALNSGLSANQARRLAQAADQAFDDAVVAMQGKVGADKVAQATAALRRADRYYAAGIKRYNDLSVEALVKDASQGAFVQPERVARYVAQPGLNDKLVRIKKVMSKDAFNEVASARWSDMLTDASDKVTLAVNGKALLKNVNAMGKSLDTLYGAERAGRIRELAKQYAALGGHIDPQTLQRGNIEQAIKTAIGKEKVFDETMKKTFMQAIKVDGPQSLRAADWLTEPNNRLYLRQALNTFGRDSPEGKALLAYNVRKMFSTMEVTASRGSEHAVKTELMGEPLVKTLDTYGRSYLEEFYGKQWTDEMYKFARTADFATRKNPSDAGKIVTAVYRLAPFTHKVALLKTFLAAEYLSKPGFVKYIGEGFTGPLADKLAKGARIGTMTGIPGVVPGTAQLAVEASKDSEFGSPLYPAKKKAKEIEQRFMGGMVDAGSPYIVGEQGPEVIIPKKGGMVVPNMMLAGDAMDPRAQKAYKDAVGDTIDARPVPGQPGSYDATQRPDQGVTPIPQNVEGLAQLLVKTGRARNIQEAREMAKRMIQQRR